MKRTLFSSIIGIALLSIGSCQTNNMEPYHYGNDTDIENQGDGNGEDQGGDQGDEQISFEITGVDGFLYFSSSKVECKCNLIYDTNSKEAVEWSLAENDYVSALFTEFPTGKYSVTLSPKVQEPFETTLLISAKAGSSSYAVEVPAKYVTLDFVESEDSDKMLTGKEQTVAYHFESNLSDTELAELKVSFVQNDNAKPKEFKIDTQNMIITVDIPENNNLEAVSYRLAISFEKSASSVTKTIQQGTYGSTRSALMAFYDSMGGENWGDGFHWGDMSVPLKDWGGIMNGGLLYQGDCDKGFIRYDLAINNGYVNGSFPEEFFELNALDGVFLWGNNGIVTGKLPSNITNCKKLYAFQVFNRMSLTSYDASKEFIVCDELWELPKLSKLCLKTYSYPGQIKLNGSHAVNSLKGIYQFELIGCDLGGNTTFPESFYQNNPDLGVLRLADCTDFCWDISNLVKFKDLRYFEIYGNINITGTFPESIGALSLLTQCYIMSKKDIVGSIPVSIGNLKNLQELVIDDCSLTGTIPQSIGGLKSLTHLDLCYNELTGQIPDSIGNLTELNRLYLYHNHFTGEIPETMLNIKAIQNKTITVDDLYVWVATQIDADTGETYFLPCPEWVKKHYGVSDWPK